MTPVTIYTTGPSCMKCRQTKRALDQGNVPYVERPIQGITDLIAEKGYQVAPVVITSTGHSWADFRIEEINKLIEKRSPKTPTSQSSSGTLLRLSNRQESGEFDSVMYDKKKEFAKGLEARGCDPSDSEIDFINEAYTAWGEHWGTEYPAWFAEHLSVFGSEQNVRDQLEDYVGGREDIRTILNVSTDEEAVNKLMNSDGEPFYFVSEKNGKWFLFDSSHNF